MINFHSRCRLQFKISVCTEASSEHCWSSFSVDQARILAMKSSLNCLLFMMILVKLLLIKFVENFARDLSLANFQRYLSFVAYWCLSNSLFD